MLLRALLLLPSFFVVTVNSFQITRTTFIGRHDIFQSRNEGWRQQQTNADKQNFCQHHQQQQRLIISSLFSSNSRWSDDEEDDDDDDDDDDDEIDIDSLGDWRQFRMNLAESVSNTEKTKKNKSNDNDDNDVVSNKSSSTKKRKIVSKENEELLEKQSNELANEYKNGVWAHALPVPEVGGLVCRLPLEVEIYKNYRYSITGKKLRKRLGLDDNDDDDDDDNNNNNNNNIRTSIWYPIAQKFVSEEMSKITQTADSQGQILINLNDESKDLLSLYIDNQQSWQEVCLVLSKDSNDNNENMSSKKSKSKKNSKKSNNNNNNNKATTIVINRPMALKLTDTLGRLVLYGSNPTLYPTNISEGNYGNDDNQNIDLKKFVQAFGKECGVYLGGPMKQDEPALLIHGIKNLKGSKEISPGTNIFIGGLKDAIDGVLEGKYKPLDFRFFIGRYEYTSNSNSNDDDDDDIVAGIVEDFANDDNNDDDYGDDTDTITIPNYSLDTAVLLGKYQPIACARSLALKQCIGLPKPLWHETLELCGGTLQEISSVELSKRTDLTIDNNNNNNNGNANVQIDDDGDIEIEIVDELNVLYDEDSDFDMDDEDIDNDDFLTF